ncbi:MAG: TlpA disulfide reductase family protein [Betaproteobacteria bacterium]
MPTIHQTPRIRRWIAWCALLCAFANLPVALAVESGQPAPDFTVADAAGKPVQLASLRGKVVYVDFWASWCAPCRRSFPWMNAMHQKYAGAGLVVLGINVDKKREAADKFLAQVPAQFSIGYDDKGAIPTLYAVKAMPSSLLIDAQGRIVYVHAGFRDEDTADLEARIRAALATRPN